ncbi:hypothetical protein [Streptomyces sp. enrichment culture]|uniref:hypothetical protein n=1 Tax=Streptomyces sp. enrichment culture TaxID=1795815 RepID=UPI003F5525B2
MDAADLDRQTLTQHDCVPPHLVTRLLERGHAGVVEHWAGQGEWFCAREWARLLGTEGRQGEALDVLAPYLATGWWTATETAAGLLETWGRTDGAIAWARAHPEGDTSYAAPAVAELLAGAGRLEEAVAELRRHPGQNVHELAGYLVDLGRVDEAVAVLHQDRHSPIGPAWDSAAWRAQAAD